MHRLQRIRRTQKLRKKLGLKPVKNLFLKNLFLRDLLKVTGLLFIIVIMFIVILNLTGCEGWSVMGYSLDKSLDTTQVIVKETYE